MSLFDLHNPSTYPFVFIFCVVLHIIADFNLQGMLADLKQEAWWKKNYPNEKYEFDWSVSLVLHGFEWSAITFLPLLVTIKMCGVTDRIAIAYMLTIILNTAVHSFIDHLKANVLKINLSQDQLCHIVQIALTLACWGFGILN